MATTFEDWIALSLAAACQMTKSHPISIIFNKENYTFTIKKETPKGVISQIYKLEVEGEGENAVVKSLIFPDNTKMNLEGF